MPVEKWKLTLDGLDALKRMGVVGIVGCLTLRDFRIAEHALGWGR
jgi:hypothetical protein